MKKMATMFGLFGIIFLFFMLLAACSRKVPIEENKSTVWLVAPYPPPKMPGEGYIGIENQALPDRVVSFNAATDNNGNPVDTTKVYESLHGKKYIWKKSRKSGKLYKKYLKN